MNEGKFPIDTTNPAENSIDEKLEQEEAPLSFEEFIELDKPLTPQEAIEKLCEFNKASPENVIKIFSNLRTYYENNDTTDTIIFKEGTSNGNKCIIIKCSDKDGNYKWNSLIDCTNGFLIHRTG